MRNFILAFGIILVVLATTSIPTSAEQDEICVCVSKFTRRMRFTKDPSKCRVWEKAVCWNMAGIAPVYPCHKVRKLAALMGQLEFACDFPESVLKALPCSAADSTSMTFTGEGISGEVIGFLGIDRISAPYSYYIAIRRQNAGLNLDAPVGQRGTLVFQRGGRTTRFVGEITEFGLAGHDVNGATYVAKVEPAVAKLKHTSGYGIHREKSLIQLITDVLNSAGITNYEIIVDDSRYQGVEFEMMYDESPGAFISRLMERDGVHYHFRQTGSAETMVIGDSNASFTSLGYALSYFGHLENPKAATEFVATFHRKSSLFTGTSVLSGYDFERPSQNILESVSTGDGFGEIFQYRADIMQGGRAYLRALVNLERESRRGQQCIGTSNAADLRAGNLFSLVDTSGDGLSDIYLTTEVRHIAFLDEQDSCFVYANAFSAIPNSVTFRPERKTPVPKAGGIVTAVVTGPAGNDRYVDEHGRIKVQFRWDREGQFDENSSAWIRVLIPAGRLEDQELFIPVVGSEVVVGFLQANPSLPLVLGSVYNGHPAFHPPVELPGAISETQ